MSNLTDKFTAFEEQTATEAAAVQVDLNAIREQLDLLNTQIDILSVNAAANTRAILAALSMNSPCAPCPTPSLDVPPVDDTTNPIDEDKCKRVQAFLHAMQEVYTVMDTISAFGVPFSPTLISDAIGQVITSLANGDETPLPSFPEAVQLVGDGINYVAGGFLVADTLVGYFTPLILDMRDAIFTSSSPIAAKAAFDGTIDGSEIPGYAKPLMKDLAYNALVSYYFDPSSDPNLTGYSGTVCALGSCLTINSEAVTFSSNMPGWDTEGNVALPPEGIASQNFYPFVGGTTLTFDENAIWIVDLFEYQLTRISGTQVNISYQKESDGSEVGVILTSASLPYVFEFHSSIVLINAGLIADTDQGPFVIELCPPEV